MLVQAGHNQNEVDIKNLRFAQIKQQACKGQIFKHKKCAEQNGCPSRNRG